MRLPWLAHSDPFPARELALEEPDGLLCAGADLSVDRLVAAYRQGIFPWYSEDEPILWWTPAKRAVIPCENIHISRSMKRFLKREPFTYSHNQCFEAVIEACSQPRPQQWGTWITEDMKQAYIELHNAGYAHSYECWEQGELVGGVYGVATGRIFSGESMFSISTNASKSTLIHIAHSNDYDWIDCQVMNPHLRSLGATEIDRERFVARLTQEIQR